MSIINPFIKRIILAAAIISGALLPSCSAINDDAEDCSIRVRFVYNWVLQDGRIPSSEANLIPGVVNSIRLYVYDTDGKFVTEKSVAGPGLEDINYEMTLDVPQGEYNLVAWGGLEDGNSFTVPRTVSKVQDAVCDMTVTQNAGKEESASSLNPIYFGIKEGAKLRLQLDGEKAETVVPLMCDVNNIVITLAGTDGMALSKDDYEFTIEDRNAHLDWDNSLRDSTDVLYRPWSIKSVYETIEGQESSGVRAEFDVSRLMETSKESRIFVRNRQTGDVVISVPLIETIKLMQSERYSSMAFQEYLDREDTYNYLFFLDGGTWTTNSLYINYWHVVLSSAHL
jgi:hypothetical protein